MSRNFPSLNALRYFEVVATQHSIKKAASLINVSESAISRQVRLLEEQLGVDLFTRQNKGLEITEAGRRLAVGLGEAFDHIEKVLDPVVLDRNVLTIKVAPTFALRWLMARLDEFRQLYPSIEVAVQTRLADMDPSESEADIGIRYGRGAWPQEDATELYPEWITPLVGAGFVSRGNIIHELQSAQLLHPTPNRQAWQLWAKKTGLLANPATGLDFETMDMALSAAQAGQGVAIGDTLLAHDAIRAGFLKAPISYAVQTGMSYYLVTKPSLKRRSAVLAFEAWLTKEIRRSRKELAVAFADFEQSHQILASSNQGATES